MLCLQGRHHTRLSPAGALKDLLRSSPGCPGACQTHAPQAPHGPLAPAAPMALLCSPAPSLLWVSTRQAQPLPLDYGLSHTPPLFYDLRSSRPAGMALQDRPVSDASFKGQLWP